MSASELLETAVPTTMRKHLETSLVGWRWTIILKSNGYDLIIVKKHSDGFKNKNVKRRVQ